MKIQKTKYYTVEIEAKTGVLLHSFQQYLPFYSDKLILKFIYILLKE